MAQKKKDDVQPAVERILTRLAERREQGQHAYPVSRATLFQEALPDAAADLLPRVLRSTTFKQRVLLSHASEPDAPVALRDDVRQLAESSQLFAVASRLAGGTSPWLLTDLTKQVAPAVRKAFGEVLRQRLRSGPVPDLAATRDDRLAAQLTAAMEHHFQDPAAGPVTVSQLARTLGMDPLRDQARLKKAAARPAFSTRVAPLREKAIDAPLVPRQRAELLATSSEAIVYLMRAARTATKHLLTATEIVKKAPAALRSIIERSIQEQLDAEQLPANVLAVWDGKKLKLLFVDDIEPPSLQRRLRFPDATRQRPAPPVEPLTPPRELPFGDAFGEAFQRLNAQAGSYNQVSLRDLRHALPAWSREAFDAELLELRRQGHFALSGLQNRFGVSDEEQSAGIREGGHLLLYVSQRR